MSSIEAFVIASKPTAHLGAGAIAQLPGFVRATGADQVVVVTDAALASTPVIATVQAVPAAAGQTLPIATSSPSSAEPHVKC